MRRRILVPCFALFVTVMGSALFRPTHSAAPEMNEQGHEVWLARILRRMDTIKPGMTRADLMKVFRTDGQPSRQVLALTALRRTFVSRDCPYFKVNVEFEPATRFGMRPPAIQPNLGFEEPQDVIVKVSKPYIEFPDTNKE